MLRTNLATRPFYDERAVHLFLALVGAGLIAVTAVNVVRVIDLSRRNTALSLQAAGDETAASQASREAEALRLQINRAELARLAAATREANELIDRRTFSWTELFNRIEATLPPDVRMTAVRPQIEEDQVSVSMVVIGRRVEDIEKFIDNLEQTGAFRELLARQEEATEDRMYRATLVGRYLTTPSPRARGDRTSSSAAE